LAKQDQSTLDRSGKQNHHDHLRGNSITLELSHGHFAHYMHLQPSSVQVKTGDHVRRGQLLGRIGSSGDAREPHPHFEVTT
jgi:murein DD-endopeptidase MepM/ murein hydrolase activator NlpD